MRETVDLGDRSVTVVGTAHVSAESRREVESAIDEVGPDLVAVELDGERLESLRNENGWRDLDLPEAIRSGKGYLLFLNLVLSIYQRRIGMEQGVRPGEEMLAAVEAAEDLGIEYELVDREVSETFRRLMEELSLLEKLKLASALVAGSPGVEVEDLTDSNIIDSIVSGLEEEFPSVGKVFLHERNSYMVERLMEQDFEHAVLVVGAAHVQGIVERLESGAGKTESPEETKVPWMKIFRYGLPATILAMLSYSFYRLGFSTGVEATTFWILSNGILASLGAVASRAHPLTWISSFVAAPLTSLDPAIGAGMVAAYVEARFYPPTVGELEDIAFLEDFRSLWSNQVGRILLAFVFVSVGSALATFISAGYIASLIA